MVYNDPQPIVYPGGARLALRFGMTLEWYAEPTVRAPDGRTATDYRVISQYRYGVNVGLRRLMDTLEAAGCVGCVSTNGIAAELWPDLVVEVAERGHEIVPHAYSQYEWNALMGEDEDRSTVKRTVEILERVSGRRQYGWSSAASRRGDFTDASLLKAGLIYTNDHRDADVPFVVARDGDRRLIALPRMDDLTDYHTIYWHGHSPGNYVDYFKRSFDRLYRESETAPGRIVTGVCHSTILGHPWGADAVAECADYALSHAGIWQATGAQLAEYALTQIA